MTNDLMRVFFSILSIVYIAGIFLWADSPVVSDLGYFNPYSLLHIPLYAILTVLLIFSFFPYNLKNNVPNVFNDPNHPNVTNENNDPNLPCLPCSQSVQGEMQSLFQWGDPNGLNDPNVLNETEKPGKPVAIAFGSKL